MTLRSMLTLVQCCGLTLSPVCWVVPEQVAAENEAEHEDKEANAQDTDVDVERQVEELLRCHLAAEVGGAQANFTQMP